ncbi:glycosyltransferase family 2 protein [Flavobacterium sp.]|uniref:glycosyltransferase family 2 protein n=1 Tax=Flavobacterium sp. TaxID=239 RepID=UPI00374DCD5D
MEYLPKVSVIVPLFNDEKYIIECLQSVKNQSYTNWECIIVNDGSTDNSESIVSDFIQNNTNFIYIKKENTGVSDTRNKGIMMSSGEFILPLDSDDKISPEYITEAITIFRKNPNTTLVYCKALFFGEKEGEFKLSRYKYSDLILKNMIFCSGIYKKQDYLKTQGYDINLKLGLEDWEFWIQLLDDKSEVVCLDKIHFYYRIKEKSRNTIHTDIKKIEEIQDYIFNKHKNLYHDLLFDNKPKIDSLYELIDKKNKFLALKKTFGYKISKIEREIKKIF